MPSIELKVNTSQAKSNVDALKKSMDGYIGSVQDLAKQGKYTEAAQASLWCLGCLFFVKNRRV